MRNKRTVHIGKQMKMARQYRGYSQAKLCSMVEGVHRSNLSRFENGHHDFISMEKVKELMHALDWPVSWLEKNHPNNKPRNKVS